MTAWYLVPCLDQLRTEFDALSPHRDRGADGSIGDTAHSQRVSDHNPDPEGRVLALDIDVTGPWPVPFADLVESVRGDRRLEYVIFNHRIASRSQAWKWRKYGGVDPHTGHAHFSARHDHTDNNSHSTWALAEVGDMTPDQMLDALETDRGKAILRNAFAELAYGPTTARESIAGRIAHIDTAVDEIEQKLDALTPPA